MGDNLDSVVLPESSCAAATDPTVQILLDVVPNRLTYRLFLGESFGISNVA